MAISLSIGRCQPHGKMLFRNRKLAKLHARRLHPAEHLNPYECEGVPGMWHYGHLPAAVASGDISRRYISTQRIDLPEQSD